MEASLHFGGKASHVSTGTMEIFFVEPSKTDTRTALGEAWGNAPGRPGRRSSALCCASRCPSSATPTRSMSWENLEPVPIQRGFCRVPAKPFSIKGCFFFWLPPNPPPPAPKRGFKKEKGKYDTVSLKNLIPFWAEYTLPRQRAGTQKPPVTLSTKLGSLKSLRFFGLFTTNPQEVQKVLVGRCLQSTPSFGSPHQVLIGILRRQHRNFTSWSGSLPCEPSSFRENCPNVLKCTLPATACNP